MHLGFMGFLSNIGALIIRIGLGGIRYYNEEPQNPILIIKAGRKCCYGVSRKGLLHDYTYLTI